MKLPAGELPGSYLPGEKPVRALLTRKLCLHMGLPLKIPRFAAIQEITAILRIAPHPHRKAVGRFPAFPTTFQGVESHQTVVRVEKPGSD